MKLVERFSGHWTIPVFRPKRHQNHTLWGDTYLYVLYEGVPPPLPPPDCFHEEMIYSPYFIAQSERHFARLIRMNFKIYNRNFAHQTRQRVIWKTLKKIHMIRRTAGVQTHPTEWSNNKSTRARFLKGRLALIQD